MTRPSDMELMLYADGELDEARKRDVETFLASDETARDKVATLDLAASLLRDGSAASSPSGSVADLVMAKVAAQGDAQSSAGAKVIPLRPRKPAVEAEAPKSGMFGRSSRAVYYFATAALAAAAAMTLWARVDPEMPALPPTAAIGELPRPAAQAEKPSAPALQAPSPEGDLDVGVEVAAVDFGSRTGTIFYLPGEGSGQVSTTTVVWVNDVGDDQ